MLDLVDFTDYDLPKLMGATNGFENLKLEDLEVIIEKNGSFFPFVFFL
jgi:hypothetical protein